MSGGKTDDGGRGTSEIKVMKSTDDSTREEDGRREQRRLGCGANLDQFETSKQEPDHNSREYLEETFNPEVNYPPAPVFSSDKVTALTIHQACGIEEWNGNAGDEEQDQKRPIFALTNQRRLECRNHQNKPKNQADEKENLDIRWTDANGKTSRITLDQSKKDSWALPPTPEKR